MHLESEKIVFNTGKTVPCVNEMFNISENGVFRTLGPDNVVQDHHLTKKEKREVMTFFINKIDVLMVMTT